MSGFKQDIVVYANPSEYGFIPGIFRSESEIVLRFKVQDLQALRESPLHPHYAPVASHRYAVSRDQGMSWEIFDTPPAHGSLIEATRGDYYAAIILDNGDLLTMSRESIPGLHRYGPVVATISRGIDRDVVWTSEVSDCGPFAGINPFSMKRLPDGSLLVAGQTPAYWESRVVDEGLDGSEEPFENVEGPPGSEFKIETGVIGPTVAFLRGTPDGRTWSYLSHIEHSNNHGFSEPGMVNFENGRILVLLRADWDEVPVEQWPEDANRLGQELVGYGYFIYQTESLDNGRTWSTPVQLPIWGHPTFPLRLKSGNIASVYSHRRPPYTVRAILSRDDGKTWDASTLREIHTFDPGWYDFGYPSAVQLDNGRILNAFYGYSTDDVGEKMPHGVFVSIFDEVWLQEKP